MTGARRIFLVAGEESGDQLGAALMRALRRRAPDAVLVGVGGGAMAAEGLDSLFPLEDVAVMGFLPVIARLPTLVRRVRETVRAVLADPPDVLVLIDSPGFTHAVAKRVRKRLPGLPVVDYVSPSVWAWRPGRAARMRPYVDHVLALLPFEPEAHARLGGPRCTYVGHPLAERLDALAADAAARAARADDPPTLLVLPGSRRAEIERLMPVFGAAVAEVARRVGDVDLVLPAVAHHRARIEALAEHWPVRPRIVAGEARKYAAFRRARAALAASGTVTLELALAGVPMVVAYKVSRAEEFVARRLVRVATIVLPNLVLGRNAVPELIQADCTPERLAEALAPLLGDGEPRAAQEAALAEVAARVRVPEPPSEAAAKFVLEPLSRAGGGPGREDNPAG